MDSSSSTTPSKSTMKTLANSSPPSPSPFIFTPIRANPPPQIQTPLIGSAAASKIKEIHKLPLPLKFEMLCELFNAMINAIRLLKLKRLTTSLTNLSRKIESLTDRKLTLYHLSQLKHIMSEEIIVDKIRVLDEETSCMKEELLVSLNTQETGNGGCSYSRLKLAFLTRIIDYATTHPESEDVAEGELPTLFYKPNEELEGSTNHQSTPALQPPTTALTSPMFKKRFSMKLVINNNTSLSEQPSLNNKALSETPVNQTKRRVLKFDEVVADDEQFHEGSLDVREEADVFMSQAWRRQQLPTANLPKLLQMIQLLFGSVGRSVMTKQELIHRIISTDLDILHKGEVEEQLEVLREVAPEFLTEDSCYSGDALQRRSAFSCAEFVGAQLLTT